MIYKPGKKATIVLILQKQRAEKFHYGLFISAECNSKIKIFARFLLHDTIFFCKNNGFDDLHLLLSSHNNIVPHNF